MDETNHSSSHYQLAISKKEKKNQKVQIVLFPPYMKLHIDNAKSKLVKIYWINVSICSLTMCATRFNLFRGKYSESLTTDQCSAGESPMSFQCPLEKWLKGLHDNRHVRPEVGFILNTECCNCCHLKHSKNKKDFEFDKNL